MRVKENPFLGVVRFRFANVSPLMALQLRLTVFEG